MNLPSKGETGANRRLSGLPFGRHLHSGVPARERRTPVPVQHLDSDLQEQVGAGFGPAHLLFLDEPFAHHLVDGRLHEGQQGYSEAQLATKLGLPVDRLPRLALCFKPPPGLLR
jgi:hypothetical protein